ncbi:MAG: type II toxin-antitoxin system Phd/YefM family antitoxin [Streptococcaceae bacterium]|jgi:PHD/YefM family antitoxin component YafN of YafNO toxin-antitoxin module|nr:type II toxin-antitoxin system Phd/YefM family antitoxin [Streptococcaceae bacterium]
MTLATSQSNFRAKMKDYMDYVVREAQPVYITRADDENAVVSKQEIYNKLVDFANSQPGSALHASLEADLIEAGIIHWEGKSYSSSQEMMAELTGEEYAARS